jgi:hypothetical protein|nr:hypothetical protein [Paraprevotella clara]DAV71931.1 MAG TPA: hypothetical protein [Caudoviricetes sp.]
MTYEDLKEEDKDRMRSLNSKNHYGLSGKELESLAKKHQKHRKMGDEYTCLLIEYRLDDINFHSEAGLLHSGEYKKVIEIAKS